MEINNILPEVEKFVKLKMEKYDSSHDWWHIDRVRKLALHIWSKEGNGDRSVVELSALLHDTGDKKFRKPVDPAPENVISEFLKKLGIDDIIIDEVIRINRYISFSSGEMAASRSDELSIVQDADRLDAIGAIGIARAFSYGGYRNNAIYIPGEQPDQKSESTIGHFYDKLLKLKDMMNTKTGRRMAEERHIFLEKFLERFYFELGFGTDMELHSNKKEV